MNRNELFDLTDDFFESKCTGLRMSDSKKWHFWREYQNGKEIAELFESTLEIIQVKTNYPIYWIEHGADIDFAWFLSKNNKQWRICNLCGSIFKKTEGFKSCCSDAHYFEYREQGYAKLSCARKKYNNRNPDDYAKRHNVTVEEAKVIISDFVLRGSHRCVEYWTSRGFTEEDAIINIAQNQTKNSPRCIEYWTQRGFTEEDAKIYVSAHQSDNAKKSKLKHGSCRKFSSRCIEYWTQRGFTEEDATNIISRRQIGYAKQYIENTTFEERRMNNHFCAEYYQKRFGTGWEEKYRDFFAQRNSSTFRSIKADNFVSLLNSKFDWMDTNRYFGEREFTTFSKELGKCFKYDYVDTKLKIVVEYHGDYWHGNPNKYPSGTIMKYPNNHEVIVDIVWAADIIKQQHMIDRGYKVFCVWESDVDEDAQRVLDKLYEEILNEDC